MFGRATLRLGIGPHSSCLMFCSAVRFCFQVRDEYRTDFDEGRGGYGVIVKQKHQYRPLGRPVP